jgi:hypothetical protein
MVFGSDEDAEFPYEFLGWSPRIGDVVVRHGSATVYGPLPLSNRDRAQLRAQLPGGTASWYTGLLDRVSQRWP